MTRINTSTTSHLSVQFEPVHGAGSIPSGGTSQISQAERERLQPITTAVLRARRGKS